MPQVVKHIRSAVAGKIPTTSELALGCLALNTYDGKLFLKKSTSGNETGAGVSIVEIGAATGSGGPITETKQTISQDLTLTTGYNGMSVGPVEIAAGYAVTVPANATWVVL